MHLKATSVGVQRQISMLFVQVNHSVFAHATKGLSSSRQVWPRMNSIHTHTHLGGRKRRVVIKTHIGPRSRPSFQPESGVKNPLN